MVQVVDNFLPPGMYGRLRLMADWAKFTTTNSSQDGVGYPGISRDIPDDVAEEVKQRLGARRVGELFMRLSLPGMDAPHQAHTDDIMGTHSFMLYMTRAHHTPPGTGTSFVKHVATGMTHSPRTQAEHDAWRRDTNNPDAWRVVSMCPSVPNRGCIFDSRLMHRAEPIGGFGTDAVNGRLVLTCFFDR